MVLGLVLEPLVSIIKDAFESLTLSRRKKGWSGTCGRRETHVEGMLTAW